MTTDIKTAWSVQIELDVHDGHTKAVAQLRADGSRSLAGTGYAHRNPTDRDVPEIGEELAAARALHALADRLLGSAVGDIAEITHESVTLDDVR